jgi:transcriptional regulator with XRE-family HTH domain
MKLHIGTNIKQLRGEKQTTQEQLADYLHISCQAVSKWENNAATPDIALLPAIAEYFDVQIDELFKVNMSGYRSKACRLASRYDMSGRKEDYEKADAEFARIFADGKAGVLDMYEYAHLHILRATALKNEAEKLLNRVIESDEEGIVYWAENWLVSLLASMGRSHESIAKYEKRRSDDPENVTNWHMLVHAYYPVGRDFNVVKNVKKALETVHQGMEKFPRDAFLHTLCGIIYKGEGRYEEALKYCKIAMGIDPELPDNHNLIPRIYYLMGDYENAIKAWEDLAARYEKWGMDEHLAKPAQEIAKIREEME